MFCNDVLLVSAVYAKARSTYRRYKKNSPQPCVYTATDFYGGLISENGSG